MAAKPPKKRLRVSKVDIDPGPFRSLPMTLILVILSLLALIVLANSAAASPHSSLSSFFTALLAFFNLSVLGLVILLWLVTRLPLPTDLPLSPGFFSAVAQSFIAPLGAAALWGLVVLLPSFRRLLARFTPLKADSPVHTLALVLAAYLVANTLITLNQGGLEALAETTEAASAGSLVLTGGALLAAAFLGVGLGTRRSWAEGQERLGLRPLRLADFRHALPWIIFLLLSQGVAGLLVSIIDPEQLKLLENVNLALLSDLDSVIEWFLLGLTSSVGEELLFRGAIQPAFGLLPTAALFAVAHLQYGLSPLMLFIFVMGIVLGYLRHRHSTNVTILVHFGYNFALGLLALLSDSLS
ncbi:MAG: CPBP family intramembrane glutamic endopeptidase [Candidatus Promineifilaceae bacterium]